MERLEGLRLWDGVELPEQLKKRVRREFETWEWFGSRIREVEKERRELLKTSSDPAVEMVRQLQLLKGIGVNCA